MPKKSEAKSESRRPSPGMSGWGAETVQERVPSGLKLVLEPDSDCILRFIGRRDISEELADKGKLKPGEEGVFYLSFYDGRRYVSMPVGHATSKVSFEPGYWYYLLHQGNVEMPGKNPMKDFAILRLGVDGETITCPARVSDSGTIILADETVGEVNYTRLNYPLRPQ